MADIAPSAGSLAELLCALSFAGDLAIGQPMEHGLKSAYLGLQLADSLRLAEAERAAIFYGALLKDAGCTACAAGFADLFGGDDLAPRRDAFLVNGASVTSALGWFMRHAAVNGSLPQRTGRLFAFLTECRSLTSESKTASCEIAEMFAQRLGLPSHVQQAVREGPPRFGCRG